MRDLILSVPDHCLSFYFSIIQNQNQNYLLVSRQNDNHSLGPGPGS